jgi:hypothetical protein
MGRKKQIFSQNPATTNRMAEWRRQWITFGEVQATGALTAGALKRKEQELRAEGKEIAQALIEDNRQGKLTRYGASHIAKAAKDYTTTKDGQTTTHRTYAVDNRVRSLTVTGVPHEEIDTEQLAKVYWMQAERQVKEQPRT